jgi:hypothetical protein
MQTKSDRFTAFFLPPWYSDKCNSVPAFLPRLMVFGSFLYAAALLALVKFVDKFF